MPREGDGLYNMRRAPGVPPRWFATVWYRTPEGLIDVQHAFEELDMLHDLIEHGPDWYAIEKIEITLAHNPTPELTIGGWP
jgi:hypothetical protein